jgi:hypothetical protein
MGTGRDVHQFFLRLGGVKKPWNAGTGSREEIDFVLCSLSFKILPWRFFARGL